MPRRFRGRNQQAQEPTTFGESAMESQLRAESAEETKLKPTKGKKSEPADPHPASLPKKNTPKKPPPKVRPNLLRDINKALLKNPPNSGGDRAPTKNGIKPQQSGGRLAFL